MNLTLFSRKGPPVGTYLAGLLWEPKDFSQ